MNGITIGANLLWGAGALALVGSALIARRLPIGTTLRLAIIWTAIFAAAALIASYFT